MLDIATLRVIWWVLLGVLFMGFAITDGYDLGVAALYPFVARDEGEKNVVLKAIRPFWEGNQVWIILGAGAIFAAWPMVYAVAFSGAYFAVLLLLLTMGISRPVSFKYRNKLPNSGWRRFWDAWIFIGGFVPAIIFGVLVGNILIGLPFYFDDELRIAYSGRLLDLFSPFALWCGLTSLAMLVMHGGVYLTVRTENSIRERAIYYSRVGATALIILFALGGCWVAYYLTGYVAQDNVDPFGYSNPLHKNVVPLIGGWMRNYTLYPMSKWVPLSGFIGAILAALLVSRGSGRLALICSAISLMGVIGTVGVSMFPFILPSSNNLSSSLLVWDASSSQLTLMVMLFAVIIFLPIILLYTGWVYHALGGKVLKGMQLDKLDPDY